MPLLTISTLFILAAVFTAGCLISWFLCDRLHQRELTRLEESMTAALEQRYHIYESLEESVRRLFARMDDARERWQEQLQGMRTSVEGSLGETTFVRRGVEQLIERVEAIGGELQQRLESALGGSTGPNHTLMRVENPELWDLEREFERRHAEQLAEISAKSQRVVELMDKITALEPTALQLAERDREFVALEQEHQQLRAQLAELEREREQFAATQQALAETRMARINELTQRLDQELSSHGQQIEALEQRLAGSEAECAALRAEAEQRADDHQRETGALELRVAELCIERDSLRQQHELALEVAAEQRVQYERRLDESETGAAELRGRIAELERRSQELALEVEARDRLVAERGARLDELQSRLNELQQALEARATELDQREKKLQELQDAWRAATGQVESQRSRLAAHRDHFEAAQRMVAQLKPMLAELETRLVPNEEDGPTLVVTDEMAERELVVNDGTLAELPADAVELAGRDEPRRRPAGARPGLERPRAALPAKPEPDPESESEQSLDLSALDDTLGERA
jgi:chromosome segregation ATPase